MFRDINIIAVDIDPAMSEVAEKYFGLKEDERMHVIIEDGLQFLTNCNKEGLYQYILLYHCTTKILISFVF